MATTPAHDTVARNAVIDASKVLKAEAQRKAPATVEVAATASMGSTKIELQDLPGIDSVAGSLPPPLPESPGATSGKGHRK